MRSTALDELPNLDATVVGTEADTQVECSCAGIKPGRTYTARQLLDAVLLMSGNDAANALADMIGGYDTAVAKMNAKAASIGAVNTHASTPSGLDGPGGSGFTTPRDLAIIFRAAMANPTFAQITSQPVAMFPSDAGEKPLVNEDELLHRYPGTIGGKTGFTDAAKKTFVAAADRGGRRLVIAMMYGLIKEGGPTYWDQAAGLLDWGFAQDPRPASARFKLLNRNASETSPADALSTLGGRAKVVGRVDHHVVRGRTGLLPRCGPSPASNPRARWISRRVRHRHGCWPT